MRTAFALVLACSVADDRDYFPSKTGFKRVYVSEDGKRDVVTVEGTKTIDEVEVLVLKFVVRDGDATRKEYYKFSDEGVHYVGTDLESEDGDDSRENPRLVLKFNAKKGDKWEYKVSDVVFTYVFEGEEEVVVPAGKFKTWKVSCTGTIGSEKNVTTEWYAKGTGLVKMESVTGGSAKSTLSLTKTE